MTVLMAIDPGPERSAWVVYNTATGGIRSAAIWSNLELLGTLRGALHGGLSPDVARVVIEKVEGFGMPVGAEVFETVFWSGRYAEAAHPLPVDRIGRKAIKVHICGTAAAKDPNIRAALIDRFGPGREKAIGRKASPGPLYGIANDLWSALAIAVTSGDLAA